MNVARDIVQNPEAKLVFFVNSDSLTVVKKIKQKAKEGGWQNSLFTSSGESISHVHLRTVSRKTTVTNYCSTL